MISRKRFLSAALAVAVGLGIAGLGAGAAQAQGTVVFAAASTKDAMTDIGNAFAA